MSSQTARSKQRILRYGLIGGGGNAALAHIQAIAQFPQIRLVGISDINSDAGRIRARQAGCPFFVDHHELLSQSRLDAVIICTPPSSHAFLALESLSFGAHVLVEKPIAMDVAEADSMISAAEKAHRILAVTFQHRFRSVVEYARKFIASGALGSLVRVLCTDSWTRTSAYYLGASWRGTWSGEGGGVLMNQASHTLDTLCYLVGLPSKVWGWTSTRFHAIECEDTAHAMLEYPNGAPGYLSVSTYEPHIKETIQIIGDQATLELVDNEVTVYQMGTPLKQFLSESSNPFGVPDINREGIAIPSNGEHGHLAIHRDFYHAILSGQRPIADGHAALMSLELANAIIFSSHTASTVTIPIDRGMYSALMANLRATGGVLP